MLQLRYKRPRRARFFTIFLLFSICLSALIIRLFYIQVVKHERYLDIAENNRNVMVKLPPKRGVIFDRNFRELATNVPKNSLYAAPRFIADKEKTAEFLAGVLEKEKEDVLARISNDKLFVWIARKLPDGAVDKIKAETITGIGFVPENERSYPNSGLAAHMLGFVDIDNNGLEGLEKYYDEALRGEEGCSVAVLDAKRRQVSSVDGFYYPPRDGFDMVLTIDESVQHIAEQSLAEGVKKHNAKSASAVVIDPSTGEILALCNWPSFNLNDIGRASPDMMRNRAITDVVEPGSSFKIVTASAVLEERAVSLDDKFDCENGSYSTGGRILHDHRPHGVLSFEDVIRVSSNIGTVKAAEILGKERLYRYITQFGFGRESGIDLPGEIKGIVREVPKWSGCSISSVPIGQEIGVTVLQLADAIACIANDGILLRPRVVKKLIDKNGGLTREFEPRPVRRVMSKETCAKVKETLRKVVMDGTGSRASIAGYSAAGKTGTAQRIEDDGSYSKTKYNSIFIGFAPVDEPRLAIAVLFVEPRPQYFGGTVAAPVFAKIAGETLRYLGVQPDL